MLYPAELLAHMPQYSNGKMFSCQQIAAHFLPALTYTIQNGKKGGYAVKECDDYTVDIEDLLYDEDAGHPSER